MRLTERGAFFEALLLRTLVVAVFLYGHCYSAGIATRSSERTPRVSTFVNNTRPTKGELLVIALPVGQGDSTLVVCPEHNGNVILVDMGSTQRGWSPDDVRAYLEQATLNGDRPLMERLSTIVISHPDLDHFNYLPIVFPRPAQPQKSARPSQFVFPAASLKNHGTKNQKRSRSAAPQPQAWKPADVRLHVYVSTSFDRYLGKRRSKFGKTMKRWLDDVKAQTFNGGKPCLMEDCRNGNTWSESLCGGSSAVRFQVLAANLGQPSHSNEQSVVLSVAYHGHKTLLVGDFEKLALQKSLLKNVSAAMISSDVYKISHHGANGANKKPWLAAVRPKMAFVSSAYPSERYGHPRCEAVRNTLASPIMQTSKLHPVACGKFTSFHDPPETTVILTNKDVYSTSPVPNQICLLQIALSSQAAIQPPQVVCWAHDYLKTRRNTGRRSRRMRVNRRCIGCSEDRLRQLLATLTFK